MPAWHEDVIFDISFRRYRTRAEAPPGRDPRRYAWEDGEICEYRLERGRPGASDRAADPPAEAGDAGTGPGRARGRPVLDPAERVRRPGPRHALVGPGRPDPVAAASWCPSTSAGCNGGAGVVRPAGRLLPDGPPCRSRAVTRGHGAISRCTGPGRGTRLIDRCDAEPAADENLGKRATATCSTASSPSRRSRARRAGHDEVAESARPDRATNRIQR